MERKYDVIVIGAGNAGLAFACTATKNGLKTLLIERNVLPGGCATSFVRGRFEYESSLHELDKRRQADSKYGFIHPCCSYPLSDLEIEVSEQ